MQLQTGRARTSKHRQRNTAQRSTTPTCTPSASRPRATAQSQYCSARSTSAIDMALLAGVLLTPNTLLWTRDKPLAALATRLGIAFNATATQS